MVITYKDGTQAIFINSDLTAARKPKYLLLGTAGSLTGEWDYSGDGAPADLPAIIKLHSPDQSVQILKQVKAAPYAFHQSVADYLISGKEMSVKTGQSRDVVAIMMAAEQSALLNAQPVKAALLK